MRQIILLILPLLLLSGCVTDDVRPGSRRSNSREIAIAMPLTGEYGKMGKMVASMIEVGLQEGLRGDMNVTIYDIATDYKLEVAASKIKSSGVKLVLGPIFSPHTTSLAKKLEGSNISLISLSNNPAIADKNIYIFCHSPIRQTRRMINYMLDDNYENFYEQYNLEPGEQHLDVQEKSTKNLKKYKTTELITNLFGDKPILLELDNKIDFEKIKY